MVEAFTPHPSNHEESQLTSADAGYLNQVRGEVARLRRRSNGNGNILGEPHQLDVADGDTVIDIVADLDDMAVIDADVPTISRRRAGRLVKRLVKSLIGWYLRYLAQQVTVLGQTTARLGSALALRADRIEDATTGLGEDLARLRDRVDRLEVELERRSASHPDPS